MDNYDLHEAARSGLLLKLPPAVFTVERLSARNAAGNVHRAAARLGVSHVGLGGWFKRRRIKL